MKEAPVYLSLIMLAAERIRIIKSRLKENKKVEVAGLSELLGVSEVTIRRDLEKLEKDGFLMRSHGGAVLRDIPDIPFGWFSESLGSHESEIAETCLQLVCDGDILMLVEGLCNLQLAKKLSERKGLTVLTNDLLIAAEIAGQSNNRVLSLGGEIFGNSHATYGSIAVRNLSYFHVNHFFFEIDGISDQFELFVNGQEKAELILDAFSRSENKVLLCPSQNFNKKGFFTLGDLSLINSLVTNPDLEDQLKKELFNRGICLYTSVNVFEGNV